MRKRTQLEELGLSFRLAAQKLDVPPQPMLRFAAVNCGKHKELCARFGVDVSVEAEPDIRWFNGLDEVKGGYDGEHTKDGILKWAHEQLAAGKLATQPKDFVRWMEATKQIKSARTKEESEKVDTEGEGKKDEL